MVFWALSIATALFVVLQYPFGWTADRFGRKPQMLVWAGLIAVGIVPMSQLIAPGASFGSVLLVFCFGLGLYAIFASIAPAIMSELFPTELRGLGIGAWYNLTVAVFGGTAPLVIQWLGDAGHSSWFFWYVAVGRRHRVRRDRSPCPRRRGRSSSEPRHRPAGRAGPRRTRWPRGRRCSRGGARLSSRTPA